MELLSNPTLNNDFPQVLFWTFIHSIWQAAFLAILAGFLLMFTRNEKPSLRYNVLFFLLLAFLGSIGFTFLYLWRNSVNEIKFITNGMVGIYIPTKMKVILFHFLNTYSNLILMGWLIIFLIKSIQLGSAFQKIHQIRKQEIQFPDIYWIERFDTLLKTLKINKKISLSTSKAMNTPATIGFLKPLVLLPFELLTKLPTDQIEVILVHELAHIKRNDYLINNIQKTIETIFFFNPFLLWISNLLRIERENCCDEIAITHVQDKKILLNALINFEEQKYSIQLGMNFGRGNGQLLNRIKRIVLKQNHTLNIADKFILTFSMFLFLGWMGLSLRSGINMHSYQETAQIEFAENNIIHKQVILPNIVIESINLSSTQDTLKVAKAITQDLITDGIILNTKSLSYKLDNDELIVNGIKQSNILHKRLKEKYIHEQGWAVFYHQKYDQNNIIGNIT